MVVLNNNSKSQTVNLARFKENLQNITSGKSVLDNKTLNLTKELTLEGETAIIIELN